jgi:hypothetical protein
MNENEKKPSNPSAFPYVDRSEAQNTLMAFSDGMTLRDYFANSAMQGFISDREMYLAMMRDRANYNADEYIAIESYRLADAMLKQREL